MFIKLFKNGNFKRYTDLAQYSHKFVAINIFAKKLAKICLTKNKHFASNNSRPTIFLKIVDKKSLQK